ARSSTSYSTLSLHDALPIWPVVLVVVVLHGGKLDPLQGAGGVVRVFRRVPGRGGRHLHHRGHRGGRLLVQRFLRGEDRGKELAGVGEPVGGVAFRGAHHQRVHFRGNPRHHPGRAGDVLVDVLVGHGDRRVTGVRLAAGEQLVEHDAARVDVAAGIRGAVRDLLRGQVGGGPHERAGL